MRDEELTHEDADSTDILFSLKEHVSITLKGI